MWQVWLATHHCPSSKNCMIIVFFLSVQKSYVLIPVNLEYQVIQTCQKIACLLFVIMFLMTLVLSTVVAAQNSFNMTGRWTSWYTSMLKKKERVWAYMKWNAEEHRTNAVLQQSLIIGEQLHIDTWSKQNGGNNWRWAHAAKQKLPAEIAQTYIWLMHQSPFLSTCAASTNIVV